MPTNHQPLVIAALAFSAACAVGGARDAAAVQQTQGTSAAQSTANTPLTAFGDTLGRYYAADFEPPRDTSDMVSRAEYVIVGEVVDAVAGRKEFLGRGCADLNAEGEGGTCKGNPNAPLYATYVNLVIRPREIAKGTLETTEADLSVELHWPTNLPIDAFTSTAPRGSRVIVLGDHVADAREAGKLLESEGIAANIAPNLVAVPPYGLIIEGPSGGTVLPLAENQPLAAVLRSKSEQVQSFADAANTLDRTARQR